MSKEIYLKQIKEAFLQFEFQLTDRQSEQFYR